MLIALLAVAAVTAGAGDDRKVTPIWSYIVASDSISYAPLYHADLVTIGTNLGSLITFVARTHQVLWSKTPSAGPIYPECSAGGYLFATSEKHLYGIDRVTGNTVWTFPINLSLTNSPVVVDESVEQVYIGFGKSIVALQMRTGLVKWTKQFEGLSYVGHRPVASQGWLFFSGASTTYAFAATGVQVWSFPTPQASLALDRSTLYLADVNGGPVVALDMTSGAVRWTFSGAYCSSVAAWNSIVLAPCGGSILGLSVATGALVFNHSSKNIMSGLSVSDIGVAYFQSHYQSDTILLAIDAFQGTPVYNFTFENSDGINLVATSKDAVYVTTDLHLYAMPLY
jgi:outer membrane protein assembly factor BamB